MSPDDAKVHGYRIEDGDYTVESIKFWERDATPAPPGSIGPPRDLERHVKVKYSLIYA